MNLTIVLDCLSVMEKEETMKTFVIDVWSLPESIHNLVAKSESHVMRMTFFLDNFNGFIVKVPKF